MYTQCPECHATYRVTATVLQQAHGRVRCGGCGISFSAIDHLSEELPDSNGRLDAPAGKPAIELPATDKLSETGRQLLATLGELSGSGDVRIEDTGTEWRVLDGDYEDNQAGDVDEAQTSLDLGDLAPIDANAAHPEDFVSEENDDGKQATGPRRRADDHEYQGSPTLDENQASLALSEPAEWSDLLDEIREGTDVSDDMPLEVEEEPAAIHNELSATENPSPVDQDDRAGDDEAAAEDTGIADDAAELASDDKIAESEDEPAAETDSAASEDELAPVAAAMPETARDESQDIAAALAGHGDPAKLFDDDSLEVETIIMEGETVRNAIEQTLLQAGNETQDQFGPTGSLFDTYANNRAMPGGRRRTDPARYGVIAWTVVLALVLVGQVIHAYRETLSTYGLFNQTIGSVYRLLGQPVLPEWNIRGWQFEETNGSIADDKNVLTILSRIGNNSELPLPYPLVHVSLTDRWEEIVGSRVLRPDEYLAGDLDPGRPVIPGENFTAVITIDEPSMDATGFKLNVCYRVVPGKMRCATEDF